jgi:hypothetical protein
MWMYLCCQCSLQWNYDLEYILHFLDYQVFNFIACFALVESVNEA